MMTEKKSGKGKAASKAAGPKTYKSLTALLSAKTAGTLPKGVKVSVDGGAVTWTAKGTTLLTMNESEFAKAQAKRLGFSLAE